jgi:hypothetical protein
MWDNGKQRQCARKALVHFTLQDLSLHRALYHIVSLIKKNKCVQKFCMYYEIVMLNFQILRLTHLTLQMLEHA